MIYDKKLCPREPQNLRSLSSISSLVLPLSVIMNINPARFAQFICSNCTAFAARVYIVSARRRRTEPGTAAKLTVAGPSKCQLAR